jgi:pimeloyl-ACP methyl ester carboxylesterase
MNASWMRISLPLLAMSAVTAVVACNRSASRDEPRSGTATAADGVPISYEVHGSGPQTLVLVHGWSCDRSYWRSQIEPFSVDYRVVTLDLAGHGSSGTGRSNWSIASFAADVAAVVKELDARNVVVIGHSLGGPVALEAGRLLGDRVDGVIGVEAFFDDWANPSFTKLVDQLRTDFPTQTRAVVRQGFFLPTSPPALVDSIASDMASAPPEIALPAIDSMLAWARERQDEAVSGLSAPIGLIVISGREAGVTRFQRARGDKPMLGIEEVAGAGHFLMREAPEAFNARLRVMLDSLPR